MHQIISKMKQLKWRIQKNKASPHSTSMKPIDADILSSAYMVTFIAMQGFQYLNRYVVRLTVLVKLSTKRK